MKRTTALFALAVVAAACSSGSSSDLGGSSSGTGTPGDDAGGGGDASEAPDTGGTGTDSGGGDDAGTDAANRTDSGNDGGTALSCAGMKYCDDFEKYDGAITNGMAVGPWKATVNGTGTAMNVDNVKPHTGARSLHITVPTGAAARGTLNQTVAAGLIAGNDMYGRAMVYYSNASGNGLPLSVHSWLFNSTGTSTVADGGVSMNMGGGGAKMQLNYHPPAPKPEASVQGGTMTAGAWHCVQWQYDGSGAPPNDAAKVWVDGTVAVDVAKSKGWDFATPWSTFDFGFTHYQTLANGVDVYLDDFALNDTMIACP
jgi:hypothetical protein